MISDMIELVYELKHLWCYLKAVLLHLTSTYYSERALRCLLLWYQLSVKIRVCLPPTVSTKRVFKRCVPLDEECEDFLFPVWVACLHFWVGVLKRSCAIERWQPLILLHTDVSCYKRMRSVQRWWWWWVCLWENTPRLPIRPLPTWSALWKATSKP